MQRLRLQEVVDANYEALKNRTLGALKHDDCKYEYGDGCKCAVGVALSEETLNNIRKDSDLQILGIGVLKQRKIIEFEDMQEFDCIFHLQFLHDIWCKENYYKDEKKIERAKKKFIVYLDKLKEELKNGEI